MILGLLLLLLILLFGFGFFWVVGQFFEEDLFELTNGRAKQFRDVYRSENVGFVPQFATILGLAIAHISILFADKQAMIRLDEELILKVMA